MSKDIFVHNLKKSVGKKDLNVYYCNVSSHCGREVAVVNTAV